MTGLELLNRLSQLSIPAPPVVTYSGQDLDSEQLSELNEYTTAIVLKGANSPERLLDEIYLLLHKLQGNAYSTPKEAIELLHDPTQLLAGRKVLLVADDPRNIFALSGVLRKQGINVVKADKGQVALDRLDEHLDIDLAIMDIMMPVMDGYESIRRIRQTLSYKNLPVIALTAKAMPEDQQACLDAGANDYLRSRSETSCPARPL